MKSKLFTLICLIVFSSGLSFAQNKASEENKYQFGESEYYLDGYSLNFEYQGASAIHLEFYNGKVKYEWITGRSKGNVNTDIPYRSRKIGRNMYLVNWHEVGKKDYLTIIFDFDKMIVHSSLIIGYQDKPERRLRTAFTSGIIDHLTINK